MDAPNKAIKCLCGCGKDAVYLCTGFEFDPGKPGCKGRPFIDEPCCINSMLYLEDGSYELNLLPFIKKRIDGEKEPV